MTRVIETGVLALGGISLFAVAFVGFARLSGAPLEEVAVIGPLFSADPDEEEQVPSLEEDWEDVFTTEEQVVEANLGILGAYNLPSPFSEIELQEFAAEIKQSKLKYDQLLDDLATREEDLALKAEQVDRQMKSLIELRDHLDAWEAQLDLRSSEIARDETTTAPSEQTDKGPAVGNPAQVAVMFEEGKADDMALRLAKYSAQEASEILKNLSPARAAELLNELPDDKWREYVDAYSAK